MKGIYKITSPTGRVYIGQSVNIERRISLYKGKHCKKQQKLYASICKYGFELHEFEVIEECDEQLLNEREEFWIEQYETFNTKRGLNLQSGGLNKRVSEETKAKISKGNKGRKRPELIECNFNRRGRKLRPETVEKIRAANTGRKHSDAAKNKISEGNKGKVFSGEAKMRMSQSGKRKVLSKEHKEKLHEWATSGKSRWRKIIDTATGVVYPSLVESAAASGYCYGVFKRKMSGRENNNTTFRYHENKL